MNNLKTRIVFGTFLSMAIVVFFARSTFSNPPAQPGQKVTVVNTSGNPVITEAVGTTKVAGAVSISGTPTVNVGNFPTSSTIFSVGSTYEINGFSLGGSCKVLDIQSTWIKCEGIGPPQQQPVWVNTTMLYQARPR